MLIVIEGVDGSGKNCVADGVAKHFDALRCDFPFVQDSPTGLVGKLFLRKKWGAYWDAMVFNEVERLGGLSSIVLQALLTVNKYEQLDLLKRHAGLHNPRHLVLAQYIPSAIVYGTMDGLDQQWLETIHAGLPPADVNILVDVGAETALDRIRIRGELKELYESRSKVEQAVEAYRSLWLTRWLGSKQAAHQHRWQWEMLSGEREVEEVVRGAVSVVEKLLGDDA